jgi:tetratricopeptide (TPR) repeat protein
MIEPSSTPILADKGFILWQAGRKQEAVALLKQLAATDPSLATTHYYLARIALDKKDYVTSLAESKRGAELRNDAGTLAVVEAGLRGFDARGVQGMREEMLLVQEKLFAGGNGSAYDLAMTYALLGKNEDAIRLLQTAFDKHEIEDLFVSENAAFDGLHNDPAFRDLIEKVRERVPQSATAKAGSR